MSIGKTIGKTLNYGYAGTPALQPDYLAITRLNVSNEKILFGDLLIYKNDMSGVEKVNATNKDLLTTHFAGIAIRQVKQSSEYKNQNEVGYASNEATGVFQRGIISIACVEGTPKLNGTVYYRYQSNNTDKPVGFTAQEDTNTGTETVKVPALVFAGEADLDGIVAVSINSKITA